MLHAMDLFPVTMLCPQRNFKHHSTQGTQHIIQLWVSQKLKERLHHEQTNKQTVEPKKCTLVFQPSIFRCYVGFREGERKIPPKLLCTYVLCLLTVCTLIWKICDRQSHDKKVRNEKTKKICYIGSNKIVIIPTYIYIYIHIFLHKHIFILTHIYCQGTNI